MKFPTRLRYALMAMLDVFENEKKGEPVSLRDVSRRTGISAKYLEQLVAGLKNRSLLRSVSGRYGGYVLNKPANEIYLGDIVEASVGPVHLADCVADERVCPRSSSCECRALWHLLNLRFRAMLFEYSLSQLMDEGHMEQVRSKIQQIMGVEERPRGGTDIGEETT